MFIFAPHKSFTLIYKVAAFIIFIGLIVGLNCVPLLTKASFPKTEKAIIVISIISTLLFLTSIFFESNGYRLKGIYTFPTIGFLFITSTILFFALCKNTKKKIIEVFLLSPLLVISIFTLLFGRVQREFKVNESTKIAVVSGGLLSCGEGIRVTQSKLIIFDKEILNETHLCLVGIYKIETVRFDDVHAEFLIFHNGEHDSENPYKYETPLIRLSTTDQNEKIVIEDKPSNIIKDIND